MLAIVNKGELPNGNHTYNIQVNNQLITTFEHKRSDGMVACFRRAAEAVEIHQIEQLVEAYVESKK